MRQIVSSIGFMGVAILIAAGFPAAQAADLRKPVLKAPPAPPSAGGFWIGAEYLLWSTKGDKLPPLLTTSPAGTPVASAGVLGAPGTSVLFGNGTGGDGWRSGVRVRAGYWFDPQHTAGIEAQFFALGSNSTNLAVSAGGNPILAEPFVDAVSGLQSALLTAFPGASSGSIAIGESSRLFGAGAGYRREFCHTCAFGSVGALIGYRFLRLQDGLAINDTITATGGFLVPGTVLAATDQFNTTNDFHGLDLGLTGDVAAGPWKLTWLAKAALGATFTNISINGATSVTVPGAGSAVSAAGLYAEPTNIGSAGSSRFSVAPELGLNVDYNITAGLHAFAGYSLLYWTGLVRPGGALDTTINITQMGGGTLAGPARPQAQSNASDFWAQGFNLGLAYNF